MMLVQFLFNGNKIFCCGNGIFVVNVQYFVVSMINCFEMERFSLFVIVLNIDNVVLMVIVNDCLYDEVYVKQVWVLGYVGDVLLVIFICGNSCDIVKVVEVVVMCDMIIVVLIGYDGGEFVGLLGLQDVEICIFLYCSVCIQEMYMLMVNCLCDLIDNMFFFYQDD